MIIIVASIILAILIIGIYWLYKILSFSGTTIEKQQNQDQTIINIEKFSVPTEKITEKITPIDYSKININSKIEEIIRDLKMRKYNNSLSNLAIVGQYIVHKVNKIMNENNLRDSIEKLNFIGRSDLSKDINQVYTEIIQLTFYEYEENNPTKISEEELEKRIYKLVDQVKSLNNSLSGLKI